MVTLAGAVAMTGMGFHRQGSNDLVKALERNNVEMAAVRVKLDTVCDQLEKQEETDKRQDEDAERMNVRVGALEKTQARILQRLGMAP